MAQQKNRNIYKSNFVVRLGDILSLEGVLADIENVEVFYFKETISFNEVQERELATWETAILYKFYVKLDSPCKLTIYLPFSLQGPIEWKQESLRNPDYQTKVAHATKFEMVENSIFRVGFYEELGELAALMPTNEEMEGITTITLKQIKQRTSSAITINISDLNLPENFFKEKKYGFGFMFKIRTRGFLSEDNMGKLSKPGHIWSFDIKIYPITFPLTRKEQEELINLHEADIWAILPKNATISHLNPSPRVVMMMEREDEESQDTYAKPGPYKTYREGQIAICWNLKNIGKEQILNYIGYSSGPEQDIEVIKEKIEKTDEIVKKLENRIESSEKKIETNQEVLLLSNKKSKNVRKILHILNRNFHQFKEKTITWDQLFAPLTLFLALFTLIMALIFSVFQGLYEAPSVTINKLEVSPTWVSLIILIIVFVLFIYLIRILDKAAKGRSNQKKKSKKSAKTISNE